eukprot:TRINITY_DN39960_c0_g2_i1.p1 TRINITY_DN39960_c0_g2~~TRINITY_DN39960_c0_g2_i1.p1  ORF type:complete len:347 (-),score=42.17 TRINITY_DN39960_c0_g2_i1:179-1219(-)
MAHLQRLPGSSLDSVAVSGRASEEVMYAVNKRDTGSICRVYEDPSQFEASSATANKAAMAMSLSKRKARLEAAAARSSAAIGALKLIWGALSLLLLLRGVVLVSGVDPHPSEETIMLVPLVTDVACLLLTAPVVVCGMFNCCLTRGFLGPSMTFCATMVLSDISSLVSWVVEAIPEASEGFEPWSLASPTFWSALLGPWEACLCSSVALESALCVCLWRIYQTIRLAGAYPVTQHACPMQSCSKEDAETFARTSTPLLEAPEDGYVACEEVFCEPSDVPLLAGMEVGEALSELALTPRGKPRNQDRRRGEREEVLEVGPRLPSLPSPVHLMYEYGGFLHDVQQSDL